MPVMLPTMSTLGIGFVINESMIVLAGADGGGHIRLSIPPLSHQLNKSVTVLQASHVKKNPELSRSFLVEISMHNLVIQTFSSDIDILVRAANGMAHLPPI